MEKENLPVIYGITDNLLSYGVQAYAIDGQTGEIIERHFCSSHHFAKDDLGFSDNPSGSSIYFHKTTRENYSKKYPDGFRMEWVGYWGNHPKVVALREQTQSKRNDCVYE